MGCLPSNDCSLSDACQHASRNEDMEIDSYIENDKKDEIGSFVAKRGSNAGSKGKTKKCHGRTLIIYPRWWSYRQLFNQSSPDSTSPNLKNGDDVTNIQHT